MPSRHRKGAPGSGVVMDNLKSTDADRGERRPKLGQRLAQQIVDEICEQGMVAGDKLPSEAKSMESYQVGRATLREALRMLEAHGVVVVRPGPGGGPMVSGTATADLANAMKLHLQLRGAVYEDVVAGRVAIEPFLARMAAEHQDPAGMIQLHEVMADLEKVDFNDGTAFHAISTRFHRALGATSGNRLVDLQAAVLLEIFNARILPEVDLPREERPGVVRVFRLIAQAIFDGEAQLAEKRVRRMLEYYWSYVQSNFPLVAKERIRWQ